MKPMSRRKRLSYLFSLVVVFILLIPVIIFYAIGYRPGSVSWFDFMRTGGILVHAERSGVEVYVDGVIEKKTGFFQHSFLISDLKPGVHQMLVKADGYSQWVKKVSVFAEKVTEVNPYLVPDKTVLTPLPQYILSDGTLVTATSTTELKKIPNKLINPEYQTVSKLFASSSSTVVATSSRVLFASADFDFTNKKNLILKNKLVLWQDGDNLFVDWLGDQDGIPYYFCSNEVCVNKKEIVVNNQISHSDFFPGKDNYVLAGLPDGIYLYEIDDRGSAQNKTVLVPGENLDFRISVNGILYVKSVGVIYIANL